MLRARGVTERHSPPSSPLPRPTAAAMASAPALPDEILEEIFMRLDVGADLVRASAACSTFRRLVSARRFLRRFHSLHSPPVLGLLDCDRYERSSLHVQKFYPVEGPHRAAAAARALALAADFNFSFVPDPCAWRPRDARDGRVVLSRSAAGRNDFQDDLVVCDPLHRRYVQIPPIPDHLAASATLPGPGGRPFVICLAPAAEDDNDKWNDEEASSFRIMVVVWIENKMVAFVFSSANQEWRAITHLGSHRFGYDIFYAHGCFFLMRDSMGRSLMLDTREMKFSILDTPPNDRGSDSAIVETGESGIGFLTIRDSGMVDLFCKAWHNNVVGAEEWQRHKTIPLPNDGVDLSCWCIVGSSQSYLSLTACQTCECDKCRWLGHCSHHFVLDLKTWHFEKLGVVHHGILGSALDYAIFPPPLAPPTI